MKKIRIIKKRMKNEGKWIEYKKKFPHRQTRFLLSEIALFINKDIDDKKIYKYETELLVETTEKLFEKGCKDIFTTTKNKDFSAADWSSLAKFLFYIYQTSTYFDDRHNKKPNIFIITDPLIKNTEKKTLWNNFALSIKDNELNRKILKKVK